MVPGTAGGVIRAASARRGSATVHAIASAVEHATSRVRRAVGFFDAFQCLMGFLFSRGARCVERRRPYRRYSSLRAHTGKSWAVVPRVRAVTLRTQTPAIAGDTR